jgi:hypothetical protein
MTKVALLLASAATVIAAAGVALFLVRPWAGSEPGPPRAAIVDQLSFETAKPEFAHRVTALLERAGYIVDYYPGEEVTVDFYRELPTLGYDFVLLRAHSGLINGGEGDGEAFLFTNESYSQTGYAEEQRERRLILATYGLGSDLSAEIRDLPSYFGIVPDFITSSMQGEFDDTTIVVMGCNGLTSNTMAKAFVEKGAKAVVSWDGLVTGDHTDEATERVLELMLEDGLAVGEAVAQARAEVGPDPWYGSNLLSYLAEEALATAP